VDVPLGQFSLVPNVHGEQNKANYLPFQTYIISIYPERKRIHLIFSISSLAIIRCMDLVHDEPDKGYLGCPGNLFLLSMEERK